MITSLTASTVRHFVVAAFGTAAFALAGCAVDAPAMDAPADTAESEESTATTSSALKAGGGGGGLGFTCTNGTCTCSKGIEGDCDRMVINCTGGFDEFDTCMEGWLTTDCSCTYSARTGGKTRPIVVGPIFTGVVLAP
jgi:hypothetical protein